MAQFLSDAWLIEADEALARSPALTRAARAITLRIQQSVTDGPDGLVVYQIRFDEHGVGIDRDPQVEPDVEFRINYHTAAAVAQGLESAQTAFLNGSLEVSGDVTRLVTHHRVIAAGHDALASLRATTTYELDA